MDAHRKLIACFAVFVMLACMVPAVTEDVEIDAAGDANGILLYEISAGTDKGVTLKNYSNKTIDLKGYSVSDDEMKSKEGYFTFTGSLKLVPGGTVTVVINKDNQSDFTTRGNTVYVVDDNDVGIKMTKKSFDPSKNGDDIFLYDASGKIIDAVCYGSVKITNSDLWIGPSISKPSHFLQREGSFDNDSSYDWFEYIEGQTRNPLEPDKYNATVTPFLFPDSGGIPIYQTLESAQKSVYIEIYLLSSPNIYALLIELEKKGVDVYLLHSGNPLGIKISDHASKMQALVDAGGEVRFILGTDNDRYSFVHCKYAIVDMETVIITSENWTDKNCNGNIDDKPYVGSNDGNRGWGAIVESKDYANYMKDVFDNDNSSAYGDTNDFNTIYKDVNPASLTYTGYQDASFDSYYAPITPVLSNDNSYEAIDYVISNATTRIYSQQQDLSSAFSYPNERSPVTLMAKQAKENPGMDAKFILGEGTSASDKATAKDQVFTINANTLISATTMDKPYVHNKGVIGDNLTLVTSVNWTPNSMDNNRESGVIINSKQVADYFAKAFNNDFEKYYDYDGFKVDISEIKTSYPSGKEITFSVTVSPSTDTYTYEWSFGDGGTMTTNVPRVVYKPSDGAHALTVKVTNSAGVSQTTAPITYYVGSDIPDESSESEFDIQEIIDEYGYVLIPLIVIILAILGVALRKHR